MTEIRILQDCILIDKKILVIGDMHLGLEENMIEKGVFPRIQLKDIIEKLDSVFELLDEEGIFVEKIVLLGDLKHEFGIISDSEWGESFKLIRYLKNKVPRIVLVKGNHDNLIVPITKRREIRLVDCYKYGNICFLHGDRLSEDCEECLNDCEIVMMGHLHPAITLSDEYKREKYKCFLRGKWKGKVAYVLPSFSGVGYGFDLGRLEDSDDGFLIINNKILKKFNVIIYDYGADKEYDFGKLDRLI